MVSAIFINPKELIFSLLKKLNLCYRKRKFIFNKEKYCISRSLDFEAIELTSDRAFRIKKFVINFILYITVEKILYFFIYFK